MGSVKEEITRLETAKKDIETAIETCGVNVPDTELIDTYASYIRQIPSAVFSGLNVDPVGGADQFIQSIKQTNGLIEATVGGLVSTSNSGLVPKADGNAGVINSPSDDYVLTYKGGTVDWYKLPANAFKNDDNNTTYTFTSGNGGFTVTPSNGSAQTVSIGKPATAGTADKLAAVSKTAWGQTYWTADGVPTSVSGDMTGVGVINGILNLNTQVGNASVYLETASNNTDYAHLFVSNKKDKTHVTRPLVLQLGYGNVGIGVAQPSQKLDVDGNVKATSFIGNLDGNYINKLTGYTKATSTSALAATDTLNAALGKLEYKTDVAYNLVKGAYDGDGTIENLAEILKVLEGIKDTETIQAIIGKYLPLAGGMMTGNITFDTNRMIRWHQSDSYSISCPTGGDGAYLLLKAHNGITAKKRLSVYTNAESLPNTNYNLYTDGSLYAASAVFGGNTKITNGSDLTLQASSGAQGDAGDIVFSDYSGAELGRIWLDSTASQALSLRYGANDAFKRILHSGNAYISNGVITINGVSITPLTSHQSLANYVTLNTAQTISATKTFSAQQSFTATGKAPFTVSSNVKVDNLNADLIGGYASASLFKRLGWNSNTTYTDADTTSMPFGLMINQQGNYTSVIKNYPTGYGYLLNLSTGDESNYSGVQIYTNHNSDRTYIRSKWGSTWYDWKTLAYTSDIPTSLPANGGNSDTVDNLHATDFVKFYLSPMTSGAPADSAKSWFKDTMPAASGAIVYNVPGSEKTIIAGKSSGAFGHMLQLNYDDNYLRLLRYYSGSWQTTDWEKISAGYADSASYSHYANVGGGSSDTHDSVLKAYFNSKKASIPRNSLLGMYSGAYGNGSYYMGYFLSGYDTNPYGGFFVAHYNSPYYVGISNGTYTTQAILTSTNYTNYTVQKDGTGASGTWGINITGTANYANSAGDADTLDGYDSSAFAKIGTYNNLTHSGNEFTFASSAFSGDMWINYRTASGSLDGAITGYYFGDGKGGNLAKITSGNFSGNSNSASKLILTSCYGTTTNGNLWSTIKTGTASYLGTATVYEVYNNGGPDTYGEVLDIVSVHNSHWQPQLWFGSGKAGRLRYRNKDYNDNSWGDWKTVAWTSEIPSVGNGTVTINQAGASKGSFTLNQSTAATINLTDTNYYPTAFSWAGGTTAGPTGSLTGVGMTAVSFGAIPSASGSASGIVTTDSQTFAGEKTFHKIRLRQPSTSGSVNYGGYLYFGDGSYAYIAELSDDKLYYHASGGHYFEGINYNFAPVLVGTIYRKPGETTYSITSNSIGVDSSSGATKNIGISVSRYRAGKYAVTLTNNTPTPVRIHAPVITSSHGDWGGGSCYESPFAYLDYSSTCVFPKLLSAGKTLSFNIICGRIHTQGNWSTGDFTKSDDNSGFICSIYASYSGNTATD